MISALDISTSALVAQRTRLNTIANNIANLSTTRNERGETEAYRPRFVVFETNDELGGPQGAAGVKVSSVQIDQSIEPRLKYEPGHPDARPDGYVEYPGTNMMAEFTNALEATRAYEASIGVIEVTKDLSQQSLRIIA